MWSLWIALISPVLLALAFPAVKVVKQYERGVLFRLGHSTSERNSA
jgi:regulator of protease activity HflC (stomatin/prohibitin superfamily)